MAEAQLPLEIGIPEVGEKRLKIAIARLNSERLNHKLPLRSCVEAVYDACANELLNAGLQLTDEVLKQRIPRHVLTVAVDQKWLPRFNELCRRDLVGGEIGYFLNVEFVGSILDYQSLFVRALESRITHWGVKALEIEMEKTSPLGVAAEETPEERSARRRAIIDPLMRKAGVTSDEDWASRAGENMDRNTPRDYRNGVTKRLRRASRNGLAKALGIPEGELPD